MGSQSGIITGEGVEMTGGCHFYDRPYYIAAVTVQDV